MTNTDYTAPAPAGQSEKPVITQIRLAEAGPLPRWRVHGSLSIVDHEDENAIGRITRPVLLDIAAVSPGQAELWAFTEAIARYGLDLTYFNVGWNGAPRVTPIEDPTNET